MKLGNLGSQSFVVLNLFLNNLLSNKLMVNISGHLEFFRFLN